MAQLEGTVKWFNNAKGYGFLGRNDGNPDVFVHYSSIQQAEGYKSLKEGEPVSFEIITGKQGLQADNVLRMDHASVKRPAHHTEPQPASVHGA